ncbi:MAG: Ig-like domain-containing protein [Ferruginibacter sp.]
MIDANGPSNDPPQPGDYFAYTNINTPVTSNFIINDGDPNNDPVSLNGVTINAGGAATPIGSPVTTAKGGTVQFYANGTFQYTPPQGYVGPDSLGYQICDVTVVAPQPLCNSAFLHLLVGVNNTTDAINDENSTWQAVSVSGNVLTNDFDAESHTQSFGSFIRQDLAMDIASGASISGIDKTGATIANAGNITFLANGNYTFIPEPSFTGTVSIPYRLCDNGNLSKCDTAYLVITVDPLPTTGINTVIANNDENRSYGSPVGGSLFGNDRDPQNDAFTVTGFGGGTVGTPGIISGIDLNGLPVANAGTLTINSNGTYSYTPSTGFVGSIDLPYTITDAGGATSTARLHIDVLKDLNGIANDPPVAGDDFGYTTINKPVTGSFIGNDSDPNGDPVSYNGVTIVSGGPHTAIGSPVATLQGGTIQFYTDGTYTYTPPSGYTGPDRITYSICDVTVVAPQPLCATATIHLLVGPGINISGTVWDDADGSITINGTEAGTNAVNTLYVNLVDGSGNVVANTAVAANGTYSFNNIDPGANYSLVLSTIAGTVSQPSPAAALPSGWTNTGENRNGTTDGGTIGVIDTRNFGYTNSGNFDFGIEQLPNTDNLTTNIPQPTVNQFIVLNGGANPPVLSGIDPEDCNGGCNLNGKTVVIDVVPANAELYYNGVLVISGQQIINFNANLLQVKITPATLGSYSVSFQYSYVDAASKKDPTPATYTLSWLSVVPVKLSVFTGMVNKCDAVLQWTTTEELNASKFIIEQSKNGIQFAAITEVTATNNPAGASYRSVVSQTAGTMYYRLRITDKDGRSGYSGIITVQTNCGSNDYMTVYPNPVRTDLTVSFYTSFRGNANLVLVNALGQQVTQRSMKVSASANTLSFDLSHFVPGIYVLYLADGSGRKISEVKKVTKE